MGTQHDALLGFRIENAHDVLPIDAFVIEQARSEVLHDDRVSKFVKLSGKPFGTSGMGIGLWHTGSKLGLLGHKLIGRVGVEVGYGDGLLGLVVCVRVGGLCPIA